MENFARVVFTIVFITILAGVIVAFGLFAIAPAEKVLKVVSGGLRLNSEPTETVEVPNSSDVPPISAGPETETPPVRPTETPSSPQPGTPENPQQSNPITESDIPAETIKLSVELGKFIPAQFTVHAGEEVSLSLTSKDLTHIFKFEDALLKNVAIGIGPDETRFIEFYAPEVPGEYPFFCDVPGHHNLGETGVMVVE